MLYSSTRGTPFLAANRLSLGAKPDEVQAIGNDPKAALAGQIGANLERDPAWERFDTHAARDAIAAYASLTSLSKNKRQAARDLAQQMGRQVRREGMQALLHTRMASVRGFAERWSGFLSNHLCISQSAGAAISAHLPLYEGAVIRRHCFGRYADLVYASATHSGMLIYLDQWRSIGPNSQVGQRRKNAGLNENYARELMELHTLGVDGGYDLDDIQNLAKILTGWTLASPNIIDRFAPNADLSVGDACFIPALHEPGTKTVLGRSYAQGQDATRAVIADLCAHPATARLLSQKLLIHFTGHAPEGDVAALAHAYLNSDGDLAVLAHALLDLDSVWQADTLIFRQPFDYLIALIRAINPQSYRQEIGTIAAAFLSGQRHVPWTAPSPQGFAEGVNAWADPNALKSRTDFARMVAGQLVDSGARIDASDLGERVLDLSAAPRLASALGNARDRDTALTLLFASPQFMWR